MPLVELPQLRIDNVKATQASVRPVVCNRDPYPGETGVPLETVVALDIVDPGNDGIDRAATRVWVDGKLAFDGAAQPELKPGFDGAGAAVVASGDTLRVVLGHEGPFRALVAVSVRVVSVTVGGQHRIDESYTFATEDRTAPRLLAAQAIAPCTVRLAFDEPVVVVDARGFAIAALDSPAVPVEFVEAAASDEVVTLMLNWEMTPGVRYEVIATGVRDLRGNPIAAPHHMVVFTGFVPPRPPRRRFDLWSMLPDYNRRADVTGDLRGLTACLQEVTDWILRDIDQFSDLWDIERSPRIDLILEDLGNPFAFELDELHKRRLAAVLAEMYRMRGTVKGIQNAVRFFLGIEITIVPYAGEGLTLGESLLGVDWVLGPSSRFARYAFDVHAPKVLTEVERDRVRAIVEYLRPGHTHFARLLEPGVLVVKDGWVLGEALLGVGTGLG